MPSFSNVKCGLIIIATITIGLFAIGMIFAFKKANVTINLPESLILYTDQSLPTSYSFSMESDTPRQTILDTWIGATLDFLESTYRSYGIRSTFLERNTYLALNSDFYIKILQQYSDTIQNISYFGNLVASTFPKLFKLIPTLCSLFIYKEYCTSFNCSNIDEVIKNNPIVLQPIDYIWALTVIDIKELITIAEQPLILTIPNPITRYIIPCNDHRANCTTQTSFVCPESIADKQNCTYLSFPSYLPNSEFYLPEGEAISDFTQPLTLLLYGWNDDFVTKVPNSASIDNTIHISKGGFLVKQSQLQKGNALNYYDGSLLSKENVELCRSPSDSFEWKDSDILICINESYCDPSFNYSIYTQENGEHVVNLDFYGITTTKMYKWNKNTKELFDFDAVPYHYLDLAFKLFNESEVQSSKEICAYWFLPYDLIERLTSLPGFSDQIHSIYFATRWLKSSYLVLEERDERIYQLIHTRKKSILG